MIDSKPLIIFLNGTSSSGKSSIAIKIQELSHLPFIHLEIDAFLGMIAFKHIDCEAIDGVNENCNKLISGFHQCFASMVKSGNNIVIDHVLQESNWLVECLSVLKDEKVYMVGVYTSLDILTEREIKRGDRSIGLAALQFNKVHSSCIYDIEVNTDYQSSEECAKKILLFINEENKPSAWTKLIREYHIE